MYKMMLENADASAEIGSSVMMIVMLGVFFVVFYFLLIRPQRKRDKELKKQIEAMRVGDKVLTIGGLVGVIANIKDDEITIYTSAANTPVTFKKSAIQSVALRNAEETAPVVRKTKADKAQKAEKADKADKDGDEA